MNLRFIFSFTLLLLFYVLYPTLVSACSPGGPDAWFNADHQIDSQTLPPNVEVKKLEVSYEPLVLVNNGNEPLYLVKENTYGRDFTGSEIPSEYIPVYKLTPNQVYYWGREKFDDEYAQWLPNSGGINNSAKTSVDINIQTYILDEPSKQISADDRPAKVEVPTPQTFRIPAYYDGEYIEIIGTINYSLNNDYDPKAMAKGIEFCNQWQAGLLNSGNPTKDIAQAAGSLSYGYIFYLIMLTPIVILGGIIFILFKVFRRRKDDT